MSKPLAFSTTELIQCQGGSSRNLLSSNFPVGNCHLIVYCLSLNFSMFSPTEDLLPGGFPNIDMGPQLKVVERTRTATMLCAASGNPDPEITWFKDFLPIDPSTSNGRIKQLRSGKTNDGALLLIYFFSSHCFCFRILYQSFF